MTWVNSAPKTDPTANAKANRQAIRRMSEAQRITGLTAKQLDDLHRSQRQRVYDRYGIAA